MNPRDCLRRIIEQWAFVFAQQRTQERAVNLAFGILCGIGRRMITRAISFHGNSQRDWWAD